MDAAYAKREPLAIRQDEEQNTGEDARQKIRQDAGQDTWHKASAAEQEALYTGYRQLAEKMILAGVRAADPREAVTANVRLEGSTLWVQGQGFNLEDYKQIILFGIGKAAPAMAASLEGLLTPDDGAVITKLGNEIGEVEGLNIPVYKAYHPEPREENVRYTQEILKTVEQLKPEERTLIIFLVSGGGSALFCAPPEGISIEDMYETNQLLMKCGARIQDINTIRKHLSRVKGGRFGKLCVDKGATVVSLILSDVVGDDLSVIASGPTYRDETTFADAVNIAEYYGIWEELPENVRQYLVRGKNNYALESPGQIPEGVYNFLIGNNMSALKAAAGVSREAGFNTMILTSQNNGEAKVIAKTIMGIAGEIQDSSNPIAPPAALIMGGEMIVTFDWEDRDGFGPNREFVLSSALELSGRENIVVAAADSDGEDGEGKSGAVADCRTVRRAAQDAQLHLDRHNAEAFFDSLGDSLEFSSYTNVNDIVVVLVGPAVL